MRTPKGLVLQPNQNVGLGKWLVIFCDEINLPLKDAYGTQKVISFMRQLTEQNGFWRDDCVWVKLSRIQFVGACNPPTDAGRVVMSSRCDPPRVRAQKKRCANERREKRGNYSFILSCASAEEARQQQPSL